MSTMPTMLIEMGGNPQYKNAQMHISTTNLTKNNEMRMKGNKEQTFTMQSNCYDVFSALLFAGSRTELTKSYDADGRSITLATPTSEAGKSNGTLPARFWASECWTKCTIVL